MILTSVFFNIFINFSWDTGEVERMSPWDLEPVPDDGMFIGCAAVHKDLCLVRRLGLVNVT